MLGRAGELTVMGKTFSSFYDDSHGKPKKSMNKVLQENKIILMKSTDYLSLKII